MRVQRFILKLCLLLLILLPVTRAEAFHLGLALSGDYSPTLQYKLPENKGRYLYKGQGSTLTLYGTGSVGGIDTNFGIYANQSEFTNVYTESNVSVDAEGTAITADPGQEKLKKKSLGLAIDSYATKGAWFRTRFAIGFNQLEIKQTGATPLKQTYSAGLEALIAAGFAPPPGKNGFSLEIGYQALAHTNGKQEGNPETKFQNLTGSSMFMSLGATLLLF